MSAPALSPLDRMLAAGGIRRIEVAAAAGCDLRALRRLAHGEWQGMRVDTLARIALALGCAVAELVPELARRPRRGLLWDAGVFRR